MPNLPGQPANRQALHPCSCQDEEDHSRPTTPWVRSVISGVDLMRDARVGAPLPLLGWVCVCQMNLRLGTGVPVSGSCSMLCGCLRGQAPSKLGWPRAPMPKGASCWAQEPSPILPPSTCPPFACPQYNKGLAFSQLERDRLYLRGLLPPAVLSQEVQAERVMTNIRR